MILKDFRCLILSQRCLIYFLLGFVFSSDGFAEFSAAKVPVKIEGSRSCKVLVSFPFDRDKAPEKYRPNLNGLTSYLIDLHTLKVNWSSRNAEKKLGNYFPGWVPAPNELPPTILEWVKSQKVLLENGKEPGSFLYKISGDSLLFSLRQYNKNNWMILMTHENFQELAILREKYQLSTREAEVVRWMTQGKKPRDISFILNMSLATTKKHIEHIESKMGTENESSIVVLGYRALYDGENRESLENVVSLLQTTYKLTLREAEVIYWLAQGKQRLDVGAILDGVSANTVRTLQGRAYTKMSITNSLEATVIVMNIELQKYFESENKSTQTQGQNQVFELMMRLKISPAQAKILSFILQGKSIEEAATYFNKQPSLIISPLKLVFSKLEADSVEAMAIDAAIKQNVIPVSDEFQKAVATMAPSMTPFNTRAESIAEEHLIKRFGLTIRQATVLYWSLQGMHPKEIATKLGISNILSIKSYLTLALNKLNVNKLKDAEIKIKESQ
jgi:DNA-binding CsgD family transcriptional regulator